jgi:hypothetical protein
MKQLERAQLNAVKGGGSWLDVPGGILNLINNIVMPTIIGTQTTNTSNTSQTGNTKKSKKKTKK